MNFISTLFKLYQLKRNQWLGTAELESLQERKLRALIRHAYKNVPYYHRLFDSAGIKPEDIKTVDDLPKIPMTTKLDLQNLQTEEITAKGVNVNKCFRTRTTGSTGTPMTVFFTTKDKIFRKLVNLRTFESLGIRVTDKIATIAEPHLFPHRRHLFQYLGFMRIEYISIFQEPQEFIQILQKIKPDVIYGDASAIRKMAAAIKEKEEKEIFLPNLKLIISSGEVLDIESRKLIESVFKVKTFDVYGNAEIGDIVAWECKERNGYHINNDSVVVEFIRNGEAVSPGERGELVLTNLHSYAMPFIRYNIGNIGVSSDRQCSCGRGLPLMEAIEGRTNELLSLPKGRVVPARFLGLSVPGIMEHRIIQEKENEVIVQLVRGKLFTEDAIHQVKQALAEVLGEDVEVHTEVVERIPKDNSGKSPIVRSNVVSSSGGYSNR